MKRLWLWAREIRWLAVLALLGVVISLGAAVLSGNLLLIAVVVAINSATLGLLAMTR